eukprot:scaffold6331_cov195-Cylindrotheca_fusiformis.AAC.10
MVVVDGSKKNRMIDNLSHNREKVRSTSKSKSHGFTYAVKQDGSLLGDELCEKRRQRKQPLSFLSSHDIASASRGLLHHRPENCLSSIQRLVKESSLQYQQSTFLPPEPVEPLDAEKVSSFPSVPDKSLPSTSNQYSNNAQSSYTKQQQQQQPISSSLQTRKENVQPNTIDFDDDYDSLLADIDVDQVIRQRQSLTNSTQDNNNITNNSNATCDTNPYRNNAFQSRNPSSNQQSSHNTNSNYTGNSAPSRNQDSYGNSSDFDYGQWDNSSTSFSNNAPLGGGGVSSNSFADGPSYDNNAGFDTNNSYYDNASSSNSNNYGDFVETSNQNYNTNSSDGPLCPGHNMPCRVFTANTETNMGRQFYKCSMPEGQACDFFQWADGMDYNNSVTATNSMVSAGPPKEMYTENQRVFGHRAFRPGQKDVIEQAIKGRDVFVLMPTGGGKSLCYQLPAWCCPGLSVIVSPLLSLIQDQVQSMTKVGVRSVFLSSQQDFDTEQKNILQELEHGMAAHGGIKLLYLTPEKLKHSNRMKSVLAKLYRMGLLNRIVVDEAHCLSDWGHDFRPDYNQLGMLRREFPSTPLMALTATANEKVVKDAIQALGMRNAYLYRSSFNRKNLHYEVRKKDGKVVDAIAAYIATKPNDSGVVYCLSRKNCEDVARKLQEKLREKGCGHIGVSFYHAKLDQQERERRHHAWSIGRIGVLCATIAFGMGIDKPGTFFYLNTVPLFSTFLTL